MKPIGRYISADNEITKKGFDWDLIPLKTTIFDTVNSVKRIFLNRCMLNS